MSEAQRGGLPARVVIRPPAWVRFVGLPLMLTWWGACVFTLVGFAVRGVGFADGTPLLASLVAYVLLLLFAVVIPPAVWGVMRYRTVLDVAEERVERRPGGVSIPVSALAGLRALPAASVNRADRGARVQLIDSAGGVAAQLEESMREWPVALAVVREWAAARPELVKDEFSRARLLRPGAADGRG